MLLTPEEIKKIRAQRDSESEARRFAIQELMAARNSNDDEGYKIALNKLSSLTVDICEHGRSWEKPCLACEEIDAQLYPEFVLDEDE